MVQRVRLAVDGVMVVSASEALWSRPVRPCGLGNGGLGNGGLGNGGLGNGGLGNGGLGNGGLGNGGLGNGGLSNGARSCGVYQGFVRELCNVTTSTGL